MRRKWEEDEKTLVQHCNHLRKTEFPLQILLFPEGTDLVGPGKINSDAFATANNLPLYDYVLHPHTSGFVTLVSHLNSKMDCLVDTCVAYPKNLVYSFLDIFLGEFPEEVHFHIHRYPIESLPRDATELDAWLKDLWARKEKRLEKFYHTGSFELAEDAGRTGKKINEACNLADVNMVAHHHLKYVGWFWVVFTLLTCYAVYTTWYVRWFLVLMSLANIMIEHQLGGYLHLEHCVAESL